MLNWFSGDTYKIEEVELTSGEYVTKADIDSIIEEMSAYAESEGIILDSYDSVQNNDHLKNIIVNAWNEQA